MTDQDWMPRPGPEHAELKSHVGAWNVDCTYFMGPDQPPMTVQAKETIEMLGPFWTVSRFESAMMGMPFKGQAVLGYDTSRGRWVGSWIDTFTPYFFAFEGSSDDGGRLVKMAGRGGDPQSGGMANYRTTEERVDADRRVFEMFKELPDGNEMKIFRYVYTRAPKATAPKAAPPKARTARPTPKKAMPKPRKAARTSAAKTKGSSRTGKARAGGAGKKKGPSARKGRR